MARRARDRGFTLIEMLIAVAISGIITGVLAAAMDISFRHNATTTARFKTANDSLSVTNRFPADIAATPPTPSSPVPPPYGREVGAGLGSECSGGDQAGSYNVIRLTWFENPGGVTTYFRVSYRIVNDSSGKGMLQRVACTSTSGPHSGYGSPSLSVVASDMAPVPPGWTSGVPAELIYTTLDDPNIRLRLTLGGAIPGTLTVGGNRLNPNATLPPPPTVNSNAAIRAQKVATETSFAGTPSTLHFTVTVLNAGTTRLDGITVADNAATTAITCGQATLNPGFSTDCTYTRTTTQADLDAGSVATAAVATGTPPAQATVSASTDTIVVTGTQQPNISVTKSTTTANYKAGGDQINYTALVRNTGNVTLSGLAITDPKMTGAANCPQTTLAPTATTTCTYSYTVQQSDLVIGGSVNSAATATASTQLGTTVSATSGTVNVPFLPNPGMTATKDTNPPGLYSYSSPGAINYTITVSNTGNVTLNSLTVADANDSDGIIPCGLTSLPAGQSTTCSAVHNVGQTEFDTEATIVNQATVTATPASGGPNISVTTNTVSVPFVAAPNVKITKSVLTNPPSFKAAGDVITFSLTVTNNGSYPLNSPITINDPNAVLSAACNSISTLAPGTSASCTATHTVVTGDLGGPITNTATVVASHPTGTVSATSNTVSVNFIPDPRMSVTLTSSPSTTFTTLNQTISYTATIQNTGNVPLSSPSIVASTHGSPWTCNGSTIAVGGSTTCTGSYQTTDNDANGSVTNVVTAQTTYNGTSTVTVRATSNSVTVNSAVQCAIRNITANPTTVARSGGTGGNALKLSAPVLVSFDATGVCSGLRIRYYPLGAPPGIIDGPDTPGVWQYTIQSGNGPQYADWNAGPAMVDVLPAAPSTTRINTQDFFPFTVT